MRKHLLLFLMAVFMVVTPVLSFAGPPDAIISTSAAENAQFAISTDVLGANTSYLAEATLDAINDGTTRYGPKDESGIIASNDQTQAQSTAQKKTTAEYAQTMATLRTTILETAATARSAPYDGTTIDQAGCFTQNSTNPLNTNVTRSEVRAANLEVGADSTPRATMEANPVNLTAAGSEVTVVIKWNDGTAQNAGRNDQFAEESSFAKNTTTSQIAENAGTTRAPTNAVQMRC